jgi:hypothetical protein
LQTVSAKNGFHGTKIGPGADERFVRAFAEQKLQCADDDGFARASFPGDGNESGSELPLEIFHEREIFYSQQSEDGGHSGQVDG